MMIFSFSLLDLLLGLRRFAFSVLSHLFNYKSIKGSHLTMKSIIEGFNGLSAFYHFLVTLTLPKATFFSYLKLISEYFLVDLNGQKI
jgi:hypothetical protein